MFFSKYIVPTSTKITNTSYTHLITISFAYIWISNFFFTLQRKQCTKRRHTKSFRQNGKSSKMLNRTEGIKVSDPKIRLFSRPIHKLIFLDCTRNWTDDYLNIGIFPFNKKSCRLFGFKGKKYEFTRYQLYLAYQ